MSVHRKAPQLPEAPPHALAHPKYRGYYMVAFGATICLTVLVYAVLVLNRAHGQQQAVGAIRGLGGDVSYEIEVEDDSGRIAPPVSQRSRLSLVFGGTFFESVVIVDFSGTDITDSDLRHLRHLPDARLVILAGTRISDEGLKDVKQLEQLIEVHLDGTHVTATGIDELRRARPDLTVMWKGN
ncbi:MAG: hypothetical protein WD847_04865 [Pirellulales bacterium]